MSTKRVTVRTISTDPVYNPGRAFKRYGYLDNNSDFWYDGNWEAEDNGLANHYPDSGEPEDFVIPFGEYEILSYDGDFAGSLQETIISPNLRAYYDGKNLVAVVTTDGGEKYFCLPGVWGQDNQTSWVTASDLQDFLGTPVELAK